MPFIIDGHNLVPKAGFNLADIDVENDLVRELQEFSRIRQTSIEVYFDGGLPGFPTRRKFGNVTIFFIRKGRTSKDANKADEAIERRLLKLGKTARNWVVVSSDHRVITAAREAHARTLTSDEFSRFMRSAAEQHSIDSGSDVNLSPDDVSMWLKEFGED